VNNHVRITHATSSIRVHQPNKNGERANPSGAASGPGEPSGSGQGPPALDFWVRYEPPSSSRYIISTHRFIWEVGGAATSVQARVTRELASNSLRCPRAPSSSALAARVRSIARNVVRRAALTVAALAAICSAFRRLVCRCTVHCWALCMDCARHTFACGCALCACVVAGADR